MGKRENVDPNESPDGVEGSIVARTIIDILKRNRTSQDMPQNAHAIAGYMPRWWAGGDILLKNILEGLVASGAIGVSRGLWKEHGDYYFYLGPLDRLARIQDDEG